MVTEPLEALKYPIGRMPRQSSPMSARERAEHIAVIERAPARFRSLVTGLSDAQLDTPYRPGGWTIRQVVHHVPDSHMNAYIRMKLAVTEPEPLVRTYEEQLWAELPDARGPVDMSLALLEALHVRWIAFLRALPEAEFRKTFMHPGWKRVFVEEAALMYAWHCRHHAAHIENGIKAASLQG
jgi:hypothetical protein